MKKFLFCCLLYFVPVYSQSPQPGFALSFDGTINGYVAIPHQPILNVSAVTIEMWMYWEDTNGDDVGFLIGKASEQLEIHTGGGAGTNGLRFIPTSGVYFDTDPGVISANGWHHIAFMYDPTVMPVVAKCYIDGIQKNVIKRGTGVSGAPITVTVNELRLGKRGDGTYPFKGRIDEVRIWNTIRTQSDITDNMGRHVLGTESGLVAYYKMSDGAGSSLTDNSANTVNGTLQSGVQWVESTAPLPVELVSFTAAVDDRAVMLRWKTATEVNNYGFEIQRQRSGIWATIGFVEGNGTSSVPQCYSFADASPDCGVFLYRLKQIDRDGTARYSAPVLVETRSVPIAWTLEQNFPNPFNASTRFRFSIAEAGRTELTIYDMLGRAVVSLVDETLEPGVHTVDWNAGSMPSGMYICRIRSGRFSAVKGCVIQK